MPTSIETRAERKILALVASHGLKAAGDIIRNAQTFSPTKLGAACVELMNDGAFYDRHFPTESTFRAELEALTSTEALTAHYGAWLAANGLPEMSADELALEEVVTNPQRVWLLAFCRRWEEVQKAEDAAADAWDAQPWRKEFPDFDRAIDVVWLADHSFEDTSWHNDACPSFTCDVFVLWIDYQDLELREFQETAAFVMQCEGETYLETDDWADVVAFVEHGRRDFPAYARKA